MNDFLTALVIVLNSIWSHEYTFFKYSINKIYIEVPTQRLSVHCGKINELGTVSFYIDLELNDSVHSFIMRRRPDYETCLMNKKEIIQILKDNKTLRILGNQNYVEEEDTVQFDDHGKMNVRLLGRSSYFWIFESLEGMEQKKCYGYFENTCEDRSFALEIFEDTDYFPMNSYNESISSKNVPIELALRRPIVIYE